LYVFVRRGFIVVPIHKKRDKTDVINYRGISILSTTYNIFSKIALSRLTPYAKELLVIISGISTQLAAIDHIFCIRQIFE